MATVKPRITITLEAKQHAVLQRMAKLQGGSMSRIVSELLQEVTPMLDKLCDTLQIATTANDELKAKILRSCEEAENDLRPIADAVASQFDLFAASIAADVGTGAASATPSDAAGDANPRPVITGVTKPEKGTNPLKVMHKGESDAL
jgi:hypothetical protein